jgi:phage baseplate assembly protein V
MPYPVAETDRQGSVQVLAGTVHSLDYEKARLRVQSGEWISAWIPWEAKYAGEVRNWRPPSVGEQCVVGCPSGSPENSFVIAFIYSDQHRQANDNRREITATDWPDEAREEYDHDRHAHRHFWPSPAKSEHTVGGTTLTLMQKAKIHFDVEGSTTETWVPGLVVRKTGTFIGDEGLTIFKGTVIVEGDLIVKGNVIVGGSVLIGGSDIAAGAQIDGGGNTNHHSH